MWTYNYSISSKDAQCYHLGEFISVKTKLPRIQKNKEKKKANQNLSDNFLARKKVLLEGRKQVDNLILM